MALNKDEMRKLLAAIGNMQYQVVGNQPRVKMAQVINILATFTDNTYNVVDRSTCVDDPDAKGYVITNISFELVDIKQEESHGSKG